MSSLVTPLPESALLQVLRGTIVVVAKSPLPGQCKTRLIPLLGHDGSATLAQAMLSDVISTLDKCDTLKSVYKVLLFAPETVQSKQIIVDIFQRLQISTVDGTRHNITTTTINNNCDTVRSADDLNISNSNSWILLPMLEGDLNTSDLGAKLEDALILARAHFQTKTSTTTTTTTTTSDNNNQNDDGSGGPVVFLGMDSPILSLQDIITGIQMATTNKSPTNHDECPSAMICPADDGGYGMVCVPSTADPKRTFSNMLWSHPLTAISQIKALTDQSIKVSIGKVMHDIDEPDDVRKLCQYLKQQHHHHHQQQQQSIKTDETSGNMVEMMTTSAYNLKNLEYVHGESKNDAIECGGGSSSNNSVSNINQTIEDRFTSHPCCFYTRQALVQAKLLNDDTN
ncbi:DUF2064 domain containing protein [Nitzschia inconspicua]|uniref:DUF2064 domain containing protein n=1 Tax=Nitzschia inconspicua TaxID=303405 RepID=A0A9K3K5T3_9STRA|nr:DUF2064 domain containing protein [Nitzschia inconspicua]KAG7358061.1 DUF2064 domain containing protein [Nitzschia inconspicua]